MNKFEQVSINGFRKDWFRDSLPANNNGEIHRSHGFFAWSVNESFASVADSMDKVINSLTRHDCIATIKLFSDRAIKIDFLCPEPNSPVKLLNTIVASFHDLMNWCIARLWLIDELQ